jgi:hypothetical protein
MRRSIEVVTARAFLNVVYEGLRSSEYRLPGVSVHKEIMGDIDYSRM